MGWLILRDAGYGIGLGALVGVATGALFMLDSPDTKYLVRGLAIGSLAGAGVGIVVGVIQGIRTEPKPAAPPPAAAGASVTWRLGVASVADSQAYPGAVTRPASSEGTRSAWSQITLLPAIEGTF